MEEALTRGFLVEEDEKAGVFRLLLLTREAEGTAVGSGSRVMTSGSVLPAGSGGGVSEAVRLAATFALKSERLGKAFLQEESAMRKYSS